MTISPLTVKQFAMLTLGQSGPPWHLGELLGVYGRSVLPLRDTITTLSRSDAMIFGAVRSAQSVATCVQQQVATSGAATELVPPSSDNYDRQAQMVNTWNEFWTNTFAAPSPSDLQELARVLATVGASIVYLSPTVYHETTPPLGLFPQWAIVGFAGSFAGLAQLGARFLPFSPSNWTADDWALLQQLQTGVVIVQPGTAYTFSELNEDGSILAEYSPQDPVPLGPTDVEMMILTGAPVDG